MTTSSDMNAMPSLFGALGIALAVGLSASGSASASAIAGQYLCKCNNDSKLAGGAPIVISGVLAIYGLIIGVILANNMNGSADGLTIVEGGRFLAAGLTVGLSCLASGNNLAMFLINYWYSEDNNVQEGEEQKSLLTGKTKILRGPSPKLDVKFLMTLCFVEAIGLYGLIAALIVIG